MHKRFLAVCSDEFDSATNESITSSTSSTSKAPTTTPPPRPFDGIPPQPINFENIEAAIAYIHREDYSEYKEKEQIAYQHMNSVFMGDGYLYQVLHESATYFIKEGVALYPEVTYEDVGIDYSYKYQDKTFYVVVYHIKEGEEYAIDLETQDYEDYREKRFGGEYSINSEMIVDHPIFKKLVSLSTEDKIGKEWMYFYSMIDDSHYILVRSDAEKSVFIDFVEGIVLDKVNIE